MLLRLLSVAQLKLDLFVYVLELLTSSHWNCLKYLLMGNTRLYLKQHEKVLAVCMLRFIYTHPTHTIKRT